MTSLIKTPRDVRGFSLIAATFTGIGVLLTFTAVTAATGLIDLVWPLKAVGWRIWVIPPTIPVNPATRHLAIGFILIATVIAVIYAVASYQVARRKFETIRTRCEIQRLEPGIQSQRSS